MKIKWKVSSTPVGRYRSFERRAWPTAWIGDSILASITCADDYSASRSREGRHAPLALFLYDYSKGVQNRSMRKAIRSYATLDEAKAALPKLLDLHPEFIPVEGKI